MAFRIHSLRSGLVLGVIICNSLVDSVQAQETKPNETPAIPDDGGQILFRIIPERDVLAPYQPLYLKLTLSNSSTKNITIPQAFQVSGVRFRIAEEGYFERTFSSGERFFRNEATIPAGKSVAAFTAVSRDETPPHPRRSPPRIFDLPASYELRVMSGAIDYLDTTEFISNPAIIRVRKPNEDEVIAGEIMKEVAHGPPYIYTGKPDIKFVEILREFLSKYRTSVFADDFKLLLGSRLREMTTFRADEQNYGNPAIRAESIQIQMTVDVKRTWVRRMAIAALPMQDLCNPQIQAHLNVREILNQWKAHPPHDPDDKIIAATLREWVPKIEASLAAAAAPK
ncbi:MAG: hypothetical protein SFU86_07995 [Pirellulaceae bacterium]|nr:hypothetical protein [Pirellulaceae bacterium]